MSIPISSLLFYAFSFFVLCARPFQPNTLFRFIANKVLKNSEHFINHLFTTNFLAPMRLTSALLPYFRARHTGVLAYVSCSSACWGPLPFTSAYSASKAALSSYVESLHRELMAIPFPSPKAGIKAVVFEVGGMPTASGGVKVPSGSFVIREIDKAIADEIPDSQSSGSQERSLLEGKGFPNIPEYTQGFMNTVVTLSPHDNPRKYTPSDPKEVARAMVDIVKGEGVAKGKKWVVRVPLGADAFEGVQRRCMETMGLLGMWKECEDLGAKPEAVTAWGAEAAGSRQKWVPGNEMRKMTSVWETERPF